MSPKPSGGEPGDGHVQRYFRTFSTVRPRPCWAIAWEARILASARPSYIRSPGVHLAFQVDISVREPSPVHRLSPEDEGSCQSRTRGPRWRLGTKDLPPEIAVLGIVSVYWSSSFA